jgi:hypothetical protein
LCLMNCCLGFVSADFRLFHNLATNHFKFGAIDDVMGVFAKTIGRSFRSDRFDRVARLSSDPITWWKYSGTGLPPDLLQVSGHKNYVASGPDIFAQ